MQSKKQVFLAVASFLSTIFSLYFLRYESSYDRTYFRRKAIEMKVSK